MPVEKQSALRRNPLVLGGKKLTATRPRVFNSPHRDISEIEDQRLHALFLQINRIAVDNIGPSRFVETGLAE